MSHRIDALPETVITTQLNPAQQEAVHHTQGPVLIIAGAGSGKTRVITTRIAHMIQNQHVPGSSIVALTFTNKAAKEMQDRIARFLGSTKDLPFIGTFHSYCLMLLKKNSSLLGKPTFSILDEDDQRKIFTRIIDKYNLKKIMTAKQLAYKISQFKNKLIDSNFEHALMGQEQLIQDIFKAYEKEKNESNCFDFDDLLLEGLKLFHKYPAFKQQFHQTIKHVLVDEYQDTNSVQHELLKQMTKNNNLFAAESLCVVGDEDQSIYSWRGATVTNIINFKKDFPQTTTIKIEQNYRSVQPILEVANHVIEYNKHRNPKKLWSERQAQDRTRSISCLSEYQEGDIIAHCTKALKKSNNLASVAVLYRAHFQSRAIEEALIKHSVPYKIVGGIQFYERKEIKDLLAYMRLIANPFDRPSFFRIINYPLRGLGEKFETEFYEAWAAEPFSTFIEISKKIIEDGSVIRTKKTALLAFISIFDNLSSQDKPSNALSRILAMSGYIAAIKKEFEPQEADTRIDNIKELLHAIEHFEANSTDTLELFLHEVALLQEHSTKKNNDSENKNPLSLMTLHGSKGLEFDTVIIAGLEEGLLPSSRSIDDPESLEEERRLFYVGITRAQEHLIITHSRYRYSYGQMTDQPRSRFLHELPTDHVSLYDGSYWNPVQMSQFFNNWFSGHEEPSDVITFAPARKTSVIQQRHPSSQYEKQEKYPRKPSLPSHTVLRNNNTHAIKHKSTPLNSGTLSGNSIDIQSIGPWKKKHPISHATFGIGIVEKIEEKNNIIYITAKFKTGVKKIDAAFLTPV